MDNYESAAPKGEGKAATGRQPPPLKYSKTFPA